MSQADRHISSSEPTLVVHTGGIGDFILACPALAHLAVEGPLHLAGRPERLALAVAAGIAETVHDLDAVGFSSLFGEPSSRLVQFLGAYRRVVVWMSDSDGHIVEVLRRCGVAEAHAFPGLPPQGWTRHASEYYLECLGVKPSDTQARLAIAPIPGHDVIIHPGSGSLRKNWPFVNFLELAHTLEAQGRRVSWIAGPAEENMPIPEAACLSPQSLVDLAGILAGARLYVGNDSGITHLAAAVGCSTFAFFGPTDPRVWAPHGGHVHVFRENGEFLPGNTRL